VGLRQAVGEDKAAQDKAAEDGSEAPQRAHMCDTERLCVRKSLLAGAGCGLFVKTPFFKGEVVCDYKSPEGIMATAEAMKLEDKSYLMRLGPQTYVDLRQHPSAVARYVNDCRDTSAHNAQFVKIPKEGRAEVVATRNIAQDEEVFVDYGRWYWAGSKMLPSRLRPTIQLPLPQQPQHCSSR